MTTVRLTADERALLECLRRQMGLRSWSDVIREAIRRLAEAEGK